MPDYLKVKIHLSTCKQCTMELNGWKNHLQPETSRVPARNIVQRQKRLTYMTISCIVVILFIVFVNGRGNYQPYYEQSLGEYNEQLNEIFTNELYSPMNADYIQSVTMYPYKAIIQYNNGLNTNQLTENMLQPVGTLTNYNYFFTKNDDSICLIDKAIMKMTCILYTFDKQQQKYIPLGVETYDIREQYHSINE